MKEYTYYPQVYKLGKIEKIFDNGKVQSKKKKQR